MENIENYSLTPQSYPSSLDAKPFEVRESRGLLIFVAVSALAISSLSFYELATDYHNHYRFMLWAIALIFLPIGIYFIISVSKPKLIIRIDDTGIWEKKSGLTKWSDISYYYTSYRYQKHISQIIFYYNSVSKNKEIKVDLSMSQYANDSTIRRYIQIFKGENEILDYGRN